MKKHLFTILLVAVFLLGLAILLYPTVSNYYNSFHQSRSIATYQETLATMEQTDYSSLLDPAQTYNEALACREQTFYSGAPAGASYSSVLNVMDDGMMGYITIRKISVSLPIYHGTSDAVLAAGVGHLEGSSLPIGGVGTHCVLSGHRGLPSSKLFTDLDQLEIGDIFTLEILNQTLTYVVDHIAIVEPEDVSYLSIDPNEDYCTLMTCTPYGVNTQRLLVRGVRTDVAAAAYVAADAIQLDPVLSAPLVAAPILLILLILLFTPSHAKRNKAIITEYKRLRAERTDTNHEK